MTNVRLARRITCDEEDVRRMLDLRHPAKLPRIQDVLDKLGKRLAVSIEEADDAGLAGAISANRLSFSESHCDPNRYAMLPSHADPTGWCLRVPRGPNLKPQAP